MITQDLDGWRFGPLSLPRDILDSFKRYVFNRIPTGGFLQAVLANDLMGAMNKADAENRHHIFVIAAFIYNEMPVNCYGSYEKVAAWLNGKEGTTDVTE